MININSTFHKIVEAKAKEPFQFGKNDCGLMVADIYLAVTGVDLAEGIRGTYSTQAGAWHAVTSRGGWDALLTSKGFEKLTNHNFVMRGDVVISNNALGIWLGNRALFAGGAYRDTTEIEAAYTYKG